MNSGPLGLVEDERFHHGTAQILSAVQDLTASGATSIICGGDTIAAANKLGYNHFSHISAGGGASLEVLAGNKLPGLMILNC